MLPATHTTQHSEAIHFQIGDHHASCGSRDGHWKYAMDDRSIRARDNRDGLSLVEDLNGAIWQKDGGIKYAPRKVPLCSFSGRHIIPKIQEKARFRSSAIFSAAHGEVQRQMQAAGADSAFNSPWQSLQERMTPPASMGHNKFAKARKNEASQGRGDIPRGRTSIGRPDLVEVRQV
mmetsp:Transcript_17512/g.48851  ORF Transcript_17512/g.48851 Transcript_17512/m.48851 type:complete len:176 (-) Transcript_17512:1143-1670(-)